MEYLNNLTDALSVRFGNILPGILGAIAVLIIGLFIARMVRRIALRLLKKTTIDEKIGKKLKTSFRIDKFVATLLYYLLVIYTMIIVLNLLGVQGVLEPLEDLVNKFVGFLPNVIGAGIIGFAGYMIASIFSEMTGFLSQRLEHFGGRIGLDPKAISLSKVIKQIVFVLIFLPILIVALDTLKMDAISAPATEMLSALLNAIPNIIAAVILLTVFYIVGKYVTTIIADLLINLGLDKVVEGVGLNSVLGDISLSRLIGRVALFFIIFTGIIAAADKLNLGQVELILTNVMNIAGKVFFGLVVLMGGIFISNIAVKALSKSDNNSYLIPIIRFAIIGIFLAFALHTMGIAESIVNLAFGLTLGAVAVAFALSFGLGGREAAGKEMSRFFDNLRKN